MTDEKGKEVTKRRKLDRDSWQWIGEIGEGSYATVWEAEMKDEQSRLYGKRFAIKVVSKLNVIRNKKQKYVVIEKRVFLKCDHPNIVKLKLTFQDENSLYFVMDLCDGELLSLIKEREKLPLSLTKLYIAEIVSALEHMHQKEIVHRDLKPENILIKPDGHIALTDFGTCRILSDDEKERVKITKPVLPEIDSKIANEGSDENQEKQRKSFVGTAEYVAPELLDNKVDNLYSLDFWSLGCVIYTCLVGHPPFRGASEYMTFQLILNNKVVFPKGVDKDARDLIEGLLQRDPSRRLGIWGGYGRLKAHSFFGGLNFERLNDMEVPSLPPIVSIDSRNRRLSEKRWLKFLDSSEVIVYGGEIEKQRRMFSSRRRTLLLTDKPRFIFIDHDTMEETKDILWSKDFKVSLTDNNSFKLRTSRKVYTLKAITGTAREWSIAIEKMLAKNNVSNSKLSLD